MADYTSAIVAAANRYGVSPSLALAVANQESGGNPNAVSSKGAIGLFQLMPATANDLGVDPTNVLQNIDGGVRYLSQLLGQYGGDPSLALAAYNAGPGNVAKYGGIPPFAETQNYVSSILAKLGLSTWLGIDASAIQDQSAGASTTSDFVSSAESVVGDGISGTAIAALALAAVAILAVFITE